jgi:nitroreductase
MYRAGDVARRTAARDADSGTIADTLRFGAYHLRSRRMERHMSAQSDDYAHLIDVVRRRRSVRRFAPGQSVTRTTLLEIAETARWAPTGANSQCFDIVIIDEADMREKVLDVFLAQSNRLIDHVKGFPAVKKTYMANTVAIFIVLEDRRWTAAFPRATSPEWAKEYAENNERILLASIGAAVQNIQLAVTAHGLTSAWLSGGGEDTTNRDLATLLGYPACMRAVGTVPVGMPEKDVASRYRRPLDQLVHWNGYQPEKFRPQAMVDHYVEGVRQFAMYRGVENVNTWEDADKRLGPWRDAYTTAVANTAGKLE